MPQIQKLEKWLEEFIRNYEEYKKHCILIKQCIETATFVIVNCYKQKDPLFPMESIAEDYITYHFHPNGFWSKTSYNNPKEQKEYLNLAPDGLGDLSPAGIAEIIKKDSGTGVYEVHILPNCGYPILEKINDKKELPYIKGLIVEI